MNEENYDMKQNIENLQHQKSYLEKKCKVMTNELRVR